MRPVREVEEALAKSQSKAEADRYVEILSVWDKVEKALMWKPDETLTVTRLRDWLELVEAKSGGDVPVRVASWDGCRQIHTSVGEVLLVDGVLYLFGDGVMRPLSEIVMEVLHLAS